MDENMKLILAEFAKINTKLDDIDARVTGLEAAVGKLDARVTGLETAVEKLDARMTDMETIIREAELDKVNTRLGMIDSKLDKLQDHYEKLDADVRVLSGETASGIYKFKHQIRKLEDQGETIVKVLEFRKLIPYRE